MMKFDYYAPTEIIFGCGRVSEAGELAARYGKKVLLVTVPEFPAVAELFAKVKKAVTGAGLELAHFDGVIPNPTTDVVSAGAKLAKEFGAEVVIGLGGGSSIDTAKAIAVEATHEGTAWDYLFYTDGPTEKTLPIIAIGTTAGTGAQTTPCSVMTQTENKDKSAIWHKNIFPRVAIVDPETTLSLPKSITAQTGFDAFSHNFEAYISTGGNPLVDVLALEGIRLAIEYLPKAYDDGSDIEARSQMSWVDTIGGMAIASAGVTLPHGLGMQVGGHCPHVTHGQALAAIYPSFTRFTYKSSEAKFATVARIFDPALKTAADAEASAKCPELIDNFLKRIDFFIGYKDLNVSVEELHEIADCGQVLADYKNNPRLASIEEMHELMLESYER